VYDTNIVATMQTIGVTRILTNNPDDFTLGLLTNKRNCANKGA
jgi:hypothetical protein